MTTTIPRWERGDAYPENWPQWLRDADIEWCRVEVRDGGTVVWYDGVWNDGYWRNGEWRNGVWLDGVWHAGEWRSGHWRSGHWYAGTWCGGSWYDDDGKAWRTDGPPPPGGEA